MPFDRAFIQYMEADRQALLAAARRTRALDHDTNRGSDFERAFRAWARPLMEPEFTVSCGEVVDSFRTHEQLRKDRRQQDTIIHKNTRFARFLSFGDDLRVVPIECVAVTLEIKLTITAPLFSLADRSAALTNRLRLATREITHPVNRDRNGEQTWVEGRKPMPRGGTRVTDALKRVWFGIVAADGPKVETLAKWLSKASTIDFVCCLSSGTASRLPFARRRDDPEDAFGDMMRYSDISPPDRALRHLWTVLEMSLLNFEHHDQNQDPEWSRYFEDYMSVRYYDRSGYEQPSGMTRLPAEQRELDRMRALRVAARSARNLSGKLSGTKKKSNR